MNTSVNMDKNAPISVMIIADEGVIDGFITKALAPSAGIEIDGHFTSGVDAISAFRRRHFDVIILDIGMATEDPLITIRRLVRVDEHIKIVMVSTLSFANVRQSMMGFDRGAAEFIQTPSDFTSKRSASQFQVEVCRVTKNLGLARRQEGQRLLPAAPKPPTPPTKEVRLRPASTKRPKILAIGSSTGGPQALMTVISALPSTFPLPIVITQHMPKTFTTVLASTLSKRSGKTAVEGEEGMILKPGHIYLAPGDFHMTLNGSAGNAKISINQNPPVNYCRPSVEPMVESVVNIFGAETLLAILTGMGSDGKKGAELVVNAGGTVIAQDFATSTVWGMPGAVAEGGFCSEVLPIDKIAPAINRIVSR
jgi:two-component system, chemotaxis family, protein-glutamate methylesterase/glutaminase